MRRIAIIQDGNEIARQQHADVQSTFIEACQILQQVSGPTEFDFFHDYSTNYFLDGLTVNEYSCVVLASNALLSNDVLKAIRDHEEHLHRYLEQDGGLVVLHQIADHITSCLPKNIECNTISKDGFSIPNITNHDDIILNYPSHIDVDHIFDDGRHEHSLFWKSIEKSSVEGFFSSVIDLHRQDGNFNESILIRTHRNTKYRIVICCIPVDWRGQKDLLANIIHYAANGHPKRLIYRLPERSSNQAVEYWLQGERTSAFVDLIWRSSKEEYEPQCPEQRHAWLLQTVDLCVLPNRELFDRVITNEQYIHFVDGGGCLLVCSTSDRPFGTEVRAIVGNFVEGGYARFLYSELRATSENWRTVESAFELRNVVCALDYLEKKSQKSGYLLIETSTLGNLMPDLLEKLNNPNDRKDFGSSMALALVGLLISDEENKDTLAAQCRWIQERYNTVNFDVKFQIKSLFSMIEDSDENTFCDIIEYLSFEDNRNISPGELARIMDSIANLENIAGIRCTRDEALSLAGFVLDYMNDQYLDDSPPWLSVEATCDICRGMISLKKILQDQPSFYDQALSQYIVEAASFLRRVRLRVDRENRTGLASLARITQTLVMAESVTPLGVERFVSLDWPEEAKDAAMEGQVRDTNFVERLSRENERLRRIEKSFQTDQYAIILGKITGSAVCLLLWVLPVILFISIYVSYTPDPRYILLAASIGLPLYLSWIYFVSQPFFRKKLLIREFEYLNALVRRRLPIRLWEIKLGRARK